MSYFIIILTFVLTLGGKVQSNAQLGCEIPESGPHKGEKSAECEPKREKVFGKDFNESQVRCKVVDVKCDLGSKKGYVAVAKVEKWLKGKGPSQIEFKFVSVPFSKSVKHNRVQAGKGLCADITLEKRQADWIATRIENPTSSSDSLPPCP